MSASQHKPPHRKMGAIFCKASEDPSVMTIGALPRFFNKYELLCIAIVLDWIGVISMLVPFVGDAFDALWAPTHAFIVWMLTDKWHYTVFAYIDEAFIGTDWVPSATMFVYYTFFVKKEPCRGYREWNSRYAFHIRLGKRLN